MLSESTRAVLLEALEHDRRPLADSLRHFYGQNGWPGGVDMPDYEKMYCDEMAKKVAAITAAIAEVNALAGWVPVEVERTMRLALHRERVFIESSDLDKDHETRELARIDAAIAWLHGLERDIL